mgnify:FL=1
MGARWTKEETDYALELYYEEQDDGTRIPMQIITVLFNEHFKRTKNYAPRSEKSIQTRISKEINKINAGGQGVTAKSQQTIRDVKKKLKNPVKRAVWRRTPSRNSGKGWTPADDNYLLKNFTADDNAQLAVAERLGRSIIACKNRLNKLRKNDGYMNTVMTSDVESAESSNEPSNVDMIPLTLWGLLALWLRNRKRNKRELKIQKLEKKIERLR